MRLLSISGIITHSAHLLDLSVLPPPRRFETNSRYYLLYCSHDLWGTLVVSRYWGGKDSRRGNQRHEVITTVEAAAKRFAAIVQSRKQHGYREVSF